MIDQLLLTEGARNLLLNCAELHAGNNILIVAVLDEARRLGM